MATCLICNKKWYNIMLETKFSFSFFYNFPVSNGHMLIVPRKCVRSYFDLSKNEQNDLWDLVNKCRKQLLRDFPKIYSFKIIMDHSEKASENLSHAHIHLIPLYSENYTTNYVSLTNY